MLVADECQRGVIDRVLDASEVAAAWLDIPKHVDAQDSRFILTAFINALSGDDKSILLTRDPYTMLRLVPLATDADTQDLLPEVIRLTLEYGWSMLLAQDDEDPELFIYCFFASLLSGLVFDSPRNRPDLLLSSTRSRILDTIHSNDFLDLAAYAIIRLKPAKSSSEAKLNENALGSLAYFFGGFARAVSKDELRRRFGEYVPNWWKFNRHLLVTEYGVPAVPSISHQKHYDSCMEMWSQIAQCIGLAQAIDEFTSPKCYSGRCPMAYSASQGARFRCGRCAQRLYCNDRCQAVDWKFGGHSPPHQQLCSDDLADVFR
ncbi:hypothetical protein FS749_002350 [Ceratobasidium sp. UAMH 11750]|nr:hypothetical protein FS749_002350 [Ceratobasidium sp. UAMH 11750]